MDIAAEFPGHVKLHILPYRVSVEVVDWLQVLIKIYICGEGYISVMSRLEVGHTAGRYAETAEYWKHRDRVIRIRVN